MSALRQAVLGLLAALLSSAVLIGSILLALAESGHKLAQAIPPTPPPPMSTPRPGEPTFTASPTPEPSSTPTSPAALACLPPAGWIQVESLPGETIDSIAQAYGISPNALRQANCDYVGNTIPSGSYLNVPAPTAQPTATETATPTSPPANTPRPGRTPQVSQAACGGPPGSWVVYIVRRGDTLYNIATSHGITVAELKYYNCLSSNIIRVGQRLYVPFVPTRVPSPATTEPPPATTEPPPATTEPPPATTEPPPATTEPPPATTEPPPATTEPPPATTEPPANSDARALSFSTSMP